MFLHGWALGRRPIAMPSDASSISAARSTPQPAGLRRHPRPAWTVVLLRGLRRLGARLPRRCPPRRAGLSSATVSGRGGDQGRPSPAGAVRTLVLVNSVGGLAWSSATGLRAITERPLWDWGLHFPTDVWLIPQATPGPARRAGRRRSGTRPQPAGPVAARFAWQSRSHWFRGPQGLGGAGGVARYPRRGDPAIGVRRDAWKLGVRRRWPRSHLRLLADPDHFGEVITNHVEVAQPGAVDGASRHGLCRRRPARRCWVRRLVVAGSTSKKLTAVSFLASIATTRIAEVDRGAGRRRRPAGRRSGTGSGPPCRPMGPTRSGRPAR